MKNEWKIVHSCHIKEENVVDAKLWTIQLTENKSKGTNEIKKEHIFDCIDLPYLEYTM